MPVNSKREAVNACLAKLINEAPEISKLREACVYAIGETGKRMRPLFTLAVVEAYGGQTEHALLPACCIELVHNYSLIHDDLPCMDDDDFRRGKPTLHKVYGEDFALLIGDYLLTKAFELLTSAPFLSTETKLQLVASLAKGSGSEGMLGGQLLDIASQTTDLKALNAMYQKKTGALISAALVCGGIIAQADQQDLDRLYTFGQDFGLIFQILDDVDDVVQKGSDAANQKTTYASLFGTANAKEQAEKLFINSLVNLRSIKGNTEPIEHIAEAFIHG